MSTDYRLDFLVVLLSIFKTDDATVDLSGSGLYVFCV